MEAARRVIPEVFGELAELTGRTYPVLDTYRMDDAEVAVVLLNSAAETAKEVSDKLRRDGVRAGVLSLNVLRPFPAEGIRQALRGVKAVPTAATCRWRCAPPSSWIRTTTRGC